MTRNLRTVALVAAHFPPSNLAGVHRARLLSQHLQEFGWRPLIVTTHSRHYEEALDPQLATLVDPALEVIATEAVPVRPVRVIGDIGVRALPWHLAALRRLRREKRFDFLHITVPSFYSALLGEMLYRQEPLPFGIDYIDPWVHVWPEAEIKYSKAWVSMKLSERLEPWAVRNAALITGVAEGYFAGVVERNPHLRASCVTAAMPYGFSTLDFDSATVAGGVPTFYDANDGLHHLVYAGALLPKAHVVMQCLFQGVARLVETEPAVAARLRLHFIGTGKSPNDREGYNVLPMAAAAGVCDLVDEHPHRMAYLETLIHLKNAAGILIVGSTEPHYTPSKVYQAVQAKRPVLALLHENSTALRVLEESGAGKAIRLSETALPSADAVCAALHAFVENKNYAPDRVDWQVFDGFSARESARRMAAALDEAYERFQRTQAVSTATV